MNKRSRDFRLPQLRTWGIRISGMLRGV